MEMKEEEEGRQKDREERLLYTELKKEEKK